MKIVLLCISIYFFTPQMTTDHTPSVVSKELQQAIYDLIKQAK